MAIDCYQLMKARHQHKISLILLLIFCLGGLTAQSIRTEFGKNRIQYHDDFSKWWSYETENFIVYWYGKGRNIAQSAVQIAEYVHPNIQNFVEHRINDKIEIIVYTDLSDLLQSNIGNEETFETKHETTKVIGSRMFVYFDGNHRNLELRIKEGIAQVYLNAMYSQGSLQEIVDSDPDLKIPTWYREGFTSYTQGAWTSRIEDELRDLWYQRKGKYQKFDRLANEHPRAAGHAMWHYIANQYGRTSITTLLYLMRLRSDFDENIEFIFGFNVKKLKKDWEAYYVEYFEREQDVFASLEEDDQLQIGYKKWFPKSTYRLSPSGDRLIYAINQIGKYNVVLRDLNTGDQEVVFTYGAKTKVQQPDYNYPIVAWHPTKNEITICYKHREFIMLRKINLNTGESIEQSIPENFRRIYHIDYITDDEYFFNATTDGYSDLYRYRAISRQHQPITEDYHDDIDARYVQLGEQWGVLFSSNRPSSTIVPERLDTTLPLNHFDVFFLPLDSDYALRLTNTPDQSEMQPKLADEHYLTYLKNENGISNRWVIDLNSRKSAYANSNYDRNIINHEAVKNSSVSIVQAYKEGAYETYISSPNWNASSTLYYTPTSTIEESDGPKEISPEPETVTGPTRPTVLFQSKFPDPEVVEPLETNAKYKVFKRNYAESFDQDEGDQEVIEFIPARAVASRRQFKLEEFVTRVDNEVLFEGLESYADQENQTEVQEAGLLLKGIAKDIFEDFKIEMGVRIPPDLKGSEFFTILDDRRKRLDRRYAIYRRQRTMNLGFSNNRVKDVTWIGLHRVSYPFDSYRSVRATGQIRVDQTFALHTDLNTRNSQRLNEKAASLKLEYVFDNSLDIDLNLHHGTKYKAYAEFINRFDLEFGNNFSFDATKGSTLVLGFDARHYQPLLRKSILALRTAGGTSFGSDKILYFVGGTDGWVTPQFEENTPVPDQSSFVYKTIAPNLRGFNHNVRNGQSFFLASAEMRIPFLKYLSRRELKSKLLRNLQVVGFFDFGSAWHGLLPNRDNSPVSQTTISAPRVDILLDLDRSVFAYSYGVGARVSLLGYFIRGDYAWGIDGDVRSPKLHISLGTDF